MFETPVSQSKAVLGTLGFGLVAVVLDYIHMFLLHQILLPIVGNHFQTPSIRLDRMGEMDRIVQITNAHSGSEDIGGSF